MIRNKLVLSLYVLIAVMTLVSFQIAVAAEKDKNNELQSLKMKAGDEKGNDMKALKAEVMISAQEERAIAQIKKLLAKYKNTQLEPDLQLRLGELYIRRSKTERFLEMHRDSEDMIRVAPQLVKNATSKKQMEAAIAIYDYIIKKYPDYEKLDVVIFNDAFASQQLADDVKSEKLYSRLVADYVNSPLLPDAHLALGEIQFHRHQFPQALAHFQAIRKFPDSNVYPYGLYKAGWTYYNMRDAVSGVRELEDVIKYGVYVKEHGIDARLDLRREALLDLALFIEDAKTSREAFAYLAKQAGELDVSAVALRLSDLYKRHSRDNDVITVLTDLIKSKPEADLVPLAYVDIMNSSDNMKKYGDVITMLKGLDNVCTPSSGWSKAQKSDMASSRDNLLAQQYNDKQDPKVTPTQLCRTAFQKMALGFANKWLKSWNKIPAETQYADFAEQAFAIYLQSDAKSDESNKARFVYAELLFKRQKFRPASENYAIVAKQTQDKAAAHDARYYALIALEKAVNDKWSDSDETLFKGLAGDYLTKNADGKFALEVEFKVAFIAYEKKRYEEAAPIFLKLGQKYVTQEKGIKSQDLYLDILNIKKDYPTLRNYALDVRNKSKDNDRREKMQKVYEEAYFLIIQGLETKGEVAKAIEEYGNFAKANPESKLTQKALWNSTQLSFKLGDMMLGAAAAVHYYEKYPTTKEGLDALMKAAQTYESMGQLTEAADVLMKLSVVDKDSKSKWSLLAADFYSLSGQTDKSKPIYEAMRKSGSPDSAIRALDQLEKMSAHDVNPKYHEAVLRDMSKADHQPQTSLADVYFVEKAYNAGDLEEAFKLAKEVISEEKDGASRSALARARLIQARILAKEFREQSLKTHLEKVQQVLVMKTEKLSKAQIAYQSAAKYGDSEVAVIALREVGDCYLQYSDSLHAMPIPKGVPDEEANAFKDQMEKLAIPMEEKGVEAKMQAYSTAKQFGVNEKLLTDLEADMKKINQTVSKDTRSKMRQALPVLPRPEGVGV